MRVRFKVTVSDDSDVVVKTADSQLQLATDVDGIDPSVAKQDFLAQAESLVRTIADNQLPALYQSVVDIRREKAESEAAAGVAGVRGKLRAMNKAKKALERANAEAAEQEAAHTDQLGGDVVECTDCGAKLESDRAHYVTVVENGRLKRDAVLCDACYDKVLEAQREQSGQPPEANDGGARPETGETGENGEAAE